MALRARKIVSIDQEKCNGCGICVGSCHEGAIQMVDGKAKLVSDAYCDGLGDCLAPCPTGAISIITRDAEEYDAGAVKARMEERKQAAPLPCGCPGSMARALTPKPGSGDGCAREGTSSRAACSQLMNWPVQLALVPPSAPYLKGADILLAADCTAVAVPDFHGKYLKGKPVIIACPKLDDNEAQADKLARMLAEAGPSSLTVLRMEVPCCGGLVRVAEEAVKRAGVATSVSTVIVAPDGAER